MFIKISFAIFYFLSVVFHKRVNEFVDIFYKLYSFEKTDRFFIYLLIVPLVIVLIGLVIFSVRDFFKALICILILILPVGLYYVLLFVSNVEAIHYIQYLIISVLLMKISGSIYYTFFASSILGIIDEAYQYFVLYAIRPHIYLDYNDMILNVHGAVIGIIVSLLVTGIYEK